MLPEPSVPKSPVTMQHHPGRPRPRPSSVLVVPRVWGLVGWALRELWKDSKWRQKAEQFPLVLKMNHILDMNKT